MSEPQDSTTDEVEEWREILEVRGLTTTYSVSSLGRVKNNTTGRILKQPLVNGYPAVGINHEGRVRMYPVHRLVLFVFVGPPPPGLECCHRDNTRTNNRLTNLRWCTRKENQNEKPEEAKERIRLALSRHCQGEANSQAKLTEDDVREIRRLLAAGVPGEAIARQFGVSRGPISSIKRGIHWKDVR